MRKLVAAAICLLSFSLSVTTGRKCIKEARTRTGKKCCEQQLRRVDKALSRVGDIPEGSWICLSHRNLILAEDKRCSMFLFSRMLRRLIAVFLKWRQEYTLKDTLIYTTKRDDVDPLFFMKIPRESSGAFLCYYLLYTPLITVLGALI